jgi:hypothetical protein
MTGKWHTFVYAGLSFDNEYFDCNSRAANPIIGLKLKDSSSGSAVAR